MSVHDMVTGVYLPDDSIAALEAYEDLVGRHVDLQHKFVGWQEPFPAEFCDQRFERGTITLVTWEPWEHLSRVGVPLTELADGTHDAHMIAWLSSIGDRLIVLRFMHEMNGNWYPWGVKSSNSTNDVNPWTTGNTPERFIAAWEHFASLARVYAPNAYLMWCPNRNGPNPALANATSWGDYVSQFAPDGTTYDVIGLDAYNSDDIWTPWNTFSGLVSEVYETLVELSDKPIILAETSSRSNSIDKAVWIHGLFAEIRLNMPKIKGLLWWQPGTTWDVDLSADSLSAYRQEMALLDRDVDIIKVPVTDVASLGAWGTVWADVRAATVVNSIDTGVEIRPWSRFVVEWAQPYGAIRNALTFDMPPFNGAVSSVIYSMKNKYFQGDNGIGDSAPGGTKNHLLSTSLTSLTLSSFPHLASGTKLAEYPAMPGWGWHSRLIDVDVSPDQPLILSLLSDRDFTGATPSMGWVEFTEWYGPGDSDSPYLLVTLDVGSRPIDDGWELIKTDATGGEHLDRHLANGGYRYRVIDKVTRETLYSEEVSITGLDWYYGRVHVTEAILNGRSISDWIFER
jgi:hypothetical protein